MAKTQEEFDNSEEIEIKIKPAEKTLSSHDKYKLRLIEEEKQNQANRAKRAKKKKEKDVSIANKIAELEYLKRHSSGDIMWVQLKNFKTWTGEVEINGEKQKIFKINLGLYKYSLSLHPDSKKLDSFKNKSLLKTDFDLKKMEQAAEEWLKKNGAKNNDN